MPTVLDEFIITLGLDPKDFDSAQRESMEKLRGFESRAAEASSRIEQAMRSGMAGFYQEFNKGLSTSGDKLDHVGDRSRRTGEKIYAAGDAGSVGFKHLTTSLLEAYAVVGTLEGAFHKLEQGAARATSTVMASLTTGISPRTLGGMAGAFPFTPSGESLGFFQQVKSWSAMIQSGQFPQQQVTALARYSSLAGVPLDMSKLSSVRGMLLEISEIVQKLSPAMRSLFLREIGAPQTMLPELMKGPAAIIKDYEEALKRMPTEGVYRELFELTEQTYKTEQAWNTLWETVEASVSKTGGKEALTGLEHGLTGVNTWIGTTNTGAEVLGTTLKGLALVIGVSLAQAIWKLVAAVSALLPYRALLAYLLPKLLASPGFSLLPSKMPAGIPDDAFLSGGHWVSPSTQMAYSSTGVALGKIDSKTGQVIPGTAPAGGGGGGSAPAGPPGAGIGTPGADETPADTAALNRVSWNETKDQNIPNAQGSGAFGPWQFIHSTWRTNAPYAGIDLSKYPTAASAPVDVQRHAALVLMRRRHGVDWDVAHGGPMPIGWYDAQMAHGEAATPPAPAPASAKAVGSHVGVRRLSGNIAASGESPIYWVQGEGGPRLSKPGEVTYSTTPTDSHKTVPNTLKPHAALVTPSASMFAKNARAGSSATGNSTFNIGDITIHTQATDADGISRHVRGAIHRELASLSTARVMQSNTIYE